VTQQPSIGRVVHYVSYGTPGGEYKSECRAATVTEVGADGTVGLCVQNPSGLFFHPLASGGCKYDPGTENDWNSTTYSGGSWHWPERV
jgi:hypothetical protein